MRFNFCVKKVLLVFFIFISLATFIVVKAVNQPAVLINEIAWMGTVNSANNEWMELFNNTDNQIDLSGWTLKLADEKLKINLKGVIPPKGFYLLERTDDSSIPGITADLIYKGSLSNSGVDLKLYDNSSNIIDEASYVGKWPSGNNATKQTMERINNFNWQTSKDPNGTPKTRNSTGATINQNITNNAISVIEKIYPNGIALNEFLPTPKENSKENEWIELYNNNAFTVDLSGWKLQDIKGAKATYVLPKSSSIESNGYLVLKRPETKIVLNDDEDGINLMWPNEKIVDFVSYSKAVKNQSYNKITSGWQWSKTLTPGAVNIVAPTLPKTQKTDNTYLSAVGESLNPNSGIKKSSPWFLFLIALGITITFGIIILLLKIKLKKRI